MLFTQVYIWVGLHWLPRYCLWINWSHHQAKYLLSLTSTDLDHELNKSTKLTERNLPLQLSLLCSAFKNDYDQLFTSATVSIAVDWQKNTENEGNFSTRFYILKLRLGRVLILQLLYWSSHGDKTTDTKIVCWIHLSSLQIRASYHVWGYWGWLDMVEVLGCASGGVYGGDGGGSFGGLLPWVSSS